VIDCDFDNDAMTCPRCGFKAGGRDWHKNCLNTAGTPAYVADVKQAAKLAGVSLPLGDWTEAGLSAIGITKERVAEWAGNPDCGCEKRKQWLNNLGGKLAALFAPTAAPPE